MTNYSTSPVLSWSTDRLQAAGLALAVCLHLAAIGWIWVSMRTPDLPAVTLMSVRLLSPAPVAPSPRPQPPKPVPVQAKPLPKPVVQRVRSETPAPAPLPERKPETAPKVAEPTPVEPARAEPAPADTVEATLPPRFDADYLSNPQPRYPSLSRRLGEQGKVFLRVHVGTNGEALEVLLQRSSGFERLDQAAREAVRSWRFVPARRGSQAVSEWVIVPVNFNIKG